MNIHDGFAQQPKGGRYAEGEAKTPEKRQMRHAPPS
jgi:hypothetical protein